MKLATNGKAHSGKRTKLLFLKLFYVADPIKKEEVTIEYCLTNGMMADCITKPLFKDHVYMQNS